MNDFKTFTKKLKALLKYDFYRNIRSLRIIIAFVLVLAIGIILAVLYGFVLKVNKSDIFIMSILYLGESNIVPLILGSLLTMDAISAEFEKGTFITTFSKPITRKFYYFGKSFSSFIYLLMEIFLLSLAAFIISFVFFGNQGKIDEAMIILSGSVLTIFFYATFTFALSAIFKNSIASFFITFGIWLALDIGVGLYSILYGYSLWTFLTPLVGETFIPIALADAYKNPNAIFKYTIFKTYNSGMTNINFSFLIVGVNILYIAILLIAGYIFFLKADIKEQ
ncbi:MAG: ABC transporter permease [Thermoplasmata archaeon]